jgi:hypothetical protein
LRSVAQSQVSLPVVETVSVRVINLNARRSIEDESMHEDGLSGSAGTDVTLGIVINVPVLTVTRCRDLPRDAIYTLKVFVVDNGDEASSQLDLFHPVPPEARRTPNLRR